MGILLAWTGAVHISERKWNPRAITQYDLAILFPAEAIVITEIQEGGFCAGEEVRPRGHWISGSS